MLEGPVSECTHRRFLARHGRMPKLRSPRRRPKRRRRSRRLTERPIDPEKHRSRGPGARAQLCGALIEQGRFDEAYMLLGSDAEAAKAFDSAIYGHIRRSHRDRRRLAIRRGGRVDLCDRVPLTFYGKERRQLPRAGRRQSLRRVNDVPGSTDAQRRWHIERIDWKRAVSCRELGGGVLIVGGGAVVAVVLRRGTSEIVGEPDDSGGPQQGPPTVLENRCSCASGSCARLWRQRL